MFGIEKEQGKDNLAEIRFDIRGTDVGILYPEIGYTQTLRLQDSSRWTYVCPIDGRKYWWRPLGPSRTVLELVNEKEQRVALFVYASEATLAPGMENGRRASESAREVVGELHILDDIKGGLGTQEEVLSSAMAVVERARRIRQQC